MAVMNEKLKKFDSTKNFVLLSFYTKEKLNLAVRTAAVGTAREEYLWWDGTSQTSPYKK